MPGDPWHAGAVRPKRWRASRRRSSRCPAAATSWSCVAGPLMQPACARASAFAGLSTAPPIGARSRCPAAVPPIRRAAAAPIRHAAAATISHAAALIRRHQRNRVAQCDACQAPLGPRLRGSAIDDVFYDRRCRSLPRNRDRDQPSGRDPVARLWPAGRTGVVLARTSSSTAAHSRVLARSPLPGINL